MRHRCVKKKSKVSPLGKTLAAATVDLAAAENRMDHNQPGLYLRAARLAVDHDHRFPIPHWG